MTLKRFVFIAFFKNSFKNNVKRMLLICVKYFTLRIAFHFDYRMPKSKHAPDESIPPHYIAGAMIFCAGCFGAGAGTGAGVAGDEEDSLAFLQASTQS
ncbi:MAG: hypothetical protein CVU55_01110 [Deltaproteobacteria bacterium HGW-Deltaproteobacteria-13]|jgi:hypothetical protein|nr:MAG: hypothetical protein CVU55_01110 [Deltaproteobacteria bacterium HGW-Deltaproteobacteria-13]